MEQTSELPGEDPLLNGRYAVEMVTGMQVKDAKGYPAMLAYLKHLTAYSTETNRGHDTYNVSAHDLFETCVLRNLIALHTPSLKGRTFESHVRSALAARPWCPPMLH